MFFKNFEQNKNSLIIENIQEIFKNKENQIYIYGKKSLGKTHLLYSACNYFDNKKCVYLPLSEKKFLNGTKYYRCKKFIKVI